jgi:hypothetical protein
VKPKDAEKRYGNGSTRLLPAPGQHRGPGPRPTKMKAPLRMRCAPPLSAFVVAISFLPGARADVYKCAGEGGVPVYQEMPCAAGKELRNFQTDPPEITILPALPRTGAPAPAAPPKEAKAANEAKAGDGAKAGKGKAAQPGDASERKHVRLGMTEGEVLARLGQPDITTGGRNGAPIRWTYMPAPGDPDTTTALVLTKGVVTDVERKVLRR